jgi:glycosyltransferase involved in cell wall biosynthesis
VSRARTAAVGMGPLVIAGLAARRHRARLAARSAASLIRGAAVEQALLTEVVAHLDRTQPLLVVVMAAYNESGSVGAVLETLPETLCGLRVCPVVIDDGSSDETPAEARRAGAVVATHRRNLGQGDALRTGFALAQRLDAEVVVTMDADGQHDPADLRALVAPVVAREADYVQGSRFAGRYDDAGGARDLGIRAFTRLITLVSRIQVTDCTNGYRAVNGASLARLRLVEDRFSAPEILIQAAGCGLRVREVPVHIRSRDVGASKKPPGLAYPLGFLGAILRSVLRVRLARP